MRELSQNTKYAGPLNTAPLPSGRYLKYTDSPRYYNILLHEWRKRFRGSPQVALDILVKAAVSAAHRAAKAKKVDTSQSGRQGVDKQAGYSKHTKHSTCFQTPGQLFKMAPLSREGIKQTRRGSRSLETTKASFPTLSVDAYTQTFFASLALTLDTGWCRRMLR